VTDREAARAAKEHLRADLHGLPGVGGIGIGRRRGDWVVTVTVTEQQLCEAVPGSYDGVAVEVRVSGPVRPLTTPGEDPPVRDVEPARPDERSTRPSQPVPDDRARPPDVPPASVGGAGTGG
jgi:hypothetical protein